MNTQNREETKRKKKERKRETGNKKRYSLFSYIRIKQGQKEGEKKLTHTFQGGDAVDTFLHQFGI